MEVVLYQLRGGLPWHGFWADVGRKNEQEEIVAKLRQVEVLTAHGRLVAEAIRWIGVTEVTYYRWRSEYGGLKGDQAKLLKELEAENNRLRRSVSDVTKEKLILKKAASEPEGQRQQNFYALTVAVRVWSLCCQTRRL
jgi:transposase-like protein